MSNIDIETELREKFHAPEDFIHAWRVTGLCRAPLHRLDDEDEEDRFEEARRAYVQSQPAHVQSVLLHEGCNIDLCECLEAIKGLRAVDELELDYLDSEEYRDALEDANDMVKEWWKQRPMSHVYSYWERRCAEMIRELAIGIPGGIELSAEELKLLEDLERQFNQEP